MAKKTLKLNYTGDAPNGNVLKAKISTSVTGDQTTFTHRHSAVIGTGVYVSPPEGYRLRLSLVDELASKGMILVSTVPVEEEVSVILLNCGREIVTVKNGDPLVNVHLEQVLDFEWEVK